MMKKVYLLYILVLIWCLASCSDEIAIMQQPIVSSDSVSVSLDFTFNSPQPATRAAEATRAVVDYPTNTPTIKNLWVLQFEGSDTTSRLISKQYIEKFSASDYSSSTGTKTIKLVDSGTATHTIVFLANTSMSSLPLSLFTSTLQSLTDMSKTISAEKELFGQGNEHGAGTAFPNDWDYNLMLYGSCPKQLNHSSESQSLSASLSFNVAKVKVTINNKSTDTSSPMTIYGAQLRQVSNIFTYYPKVATDNEERPTQLEINPIDYPLEYIYKDGADLSATESGWTKTWYVPLNLRGKSTVISQASTEKGTQKDKSRYAPANATYLFVEGKYFDEMTNDSVPVSYTYFLGSDLTNNFNLKPGYEYTYIVNIKGHNAADGDYRMDEYAPVDFTDSKWDRANSYILNPAPLGSGYERKFTIPLDKINNFWGDGKYEEVNTNRLTTNYPNWTASILWTDFDNTDRKLKLVTPTGTVTSDTDPGKFTVSVSPGLSGNAVIAVKGGDGGTNILWSWHLWITDYNPYEANNYTWQTGQYVYPVTGGSVHKYDGGVWSATSTTYTSKYKNKNVFFMDRNLGALSPFYTKDGRGTLFYEYGRKDPFPQYFIPAEGDFSGGGISHVEVTNSASDENVRLSVYNPTILYYHNYGTDNDRGMWTGNTKYSGDNWFEKGGGTKGTKSFFDPCPPGYKVPDYDNGASANIWTDLYRNAGHVNIKTQYPSTYNGKNITVETDPTSQNGGLTRELPTISQVKGVCYWPGSGKAPSTYIIYPFAGRMGTNGVSYSGSRLYVWTTSKNGDNNARTLRVPQNGNLTVSSDGMSYGCSVRCIKE